MTVTCRYDSVSTRAVRSPAIPAPSTTACSPTIPMVTCPLQPTCAGIIRLLPHVLDREYARYRPAWPCELLLFSSLPYARYHEAGGRVSQTRIGGRRWSPPPGHQARVTKPRPLDGAAFTGELFRIVDDLLAIPQPRNERGRDQVVGVLSAAIAGAIPRSGEARADLFAIVKTCLDYHGGLQQLHQAIRGF